MGKAARPSVHAWLLTQASRSFPPRAGNFFFGGGTGATIQTITLVPGFIVCNSLPWLDYLPWFPGLLDGKTLNHLQLS